MAKGGNGIGKGKPNTAPTLVDTSTSVNENTASSFSVAATDPDKKDILSYRRSRQRNSLFRGWVGIAPATLVLKN